MPTKEIQPPPLPPRLANGGQHLHAKISVSGLSGCSSFCQSCGWHWVSGLLQPVCEGLWCQVGLSSALGVPRWINWGPLPTLALLPG